MQVDISVMYDVFEYNLFEVEFVLLVVMPNWRASSKKDEQIRAHYQQ